MLSVLVAQYASHAPTMGIEPSTEIVGQEGLQGAGPYMKIGFRLGAGCIRDARFETYGCPVAIACGSWLTQWLEGKTIEQAGVIEADDLMTVLGGVPLGKEHCAQLAINALRSALKQVDASLS